MFFIDKMTPDWVNNFNIPGTFEPELAFNREEFFKRDNYIKFVKEEENHGIGGLNPGHYHMSEDFTLTICSQAGSEEDVVNQLAKLPHADKMKKIIIE